MTRLLLLLVFATNLHAGLLGDLKRGAHPVGFKVIERYDASRPFIYPFDIDGKRRSGVDRPMQISVWYPAMSESRSPMTLGDYVALMPREQDFAATGDGAGIYFNFDRLRTATPEQRKQILAMEATAVRDARASNGTFPLILWSLGSPALYHASAEYLASHGYVIAIMPRLPATRSLVDAAQTREDHDAKSRDMAFMLEELSRFAPADTANVGVTGFSAGGRWALGEAMRNPNVRGVVSHDSILLFGDGQQFAEMPFYAADRVRVPLLHMIRREWVPRETSTLWNELRHSDRVKWVFETPGVDHVDFTGAPYAGTLAGMHAEHRKAIADTFHAFNRATLVFFDWTLKGDAAPWQKIAGGTGDASISVERGAVTAKLPDPRMIQEALVESTDRALELFRKVWKESGTPPVPEGTLNLAGYQLIALGRPKDALKAFSTNAVAFPTSSNVYDSLADGYQANGDPAKALELSQKVLELLPNDASITPERRELIRRSAEARIQQLSERR
ncbi:MAG TPA: hypothetical protein VEU30_06540 [Thermoanaerobaculia bacterium]|nr:hypothetical protein [Thermoanaerobaculia bacterium]